MATLNPNPVTLPGVTIERHPWTCRVISPKYLRVCVCASVCLLRSSPTPGEQNRRVDKLNANNIHQPRFSLRWRAVMCSTSKACFICGISGNKGFSKYGKTDLRLFWKMHCINVDEVMRVTELRAILNSFLSSASVLVEVQSYYWWCDCIWHCCIFILTAGKCPTETEQLFNSFSF